MASVLAFAMTASAANYTWDTMAGDSAITDGSGTWQVGVGNMEGHALSWPFRVPDATRLRKFSTFADRTTVDKKA